jgi:GDPmannose 4,6-dehydratase
MSDINYNTKKILITGINGQDGSNMAKYLLSLNIMCDLYGTIRNSYSSLKNIEDIKNKINIIELDISKRDEIINIFLKIMPDIIINFASEQPQTQRNELILFETNTQSVITFLDCITKYKNTCRFFSSGSSMEYGTIKCQTFSTVEPELDASPKGVTLHDNITKKIVNIDDICNPDTIYGMSKLNNRYFVNYYRKKYSIFAIHCVFFSHESYGRSDVFFTKKIINSLINIKKSIMNNEIFEVLEIGNIDSKRDWSDSRDFIEAIWKMIESKKSNNYILSSGTEHSIEEFINICCNKLNLNNCIWKNNNNLMELYYNDSMIIKQNEKFMRQDDFHLIGDIRDTKRLINWEPKISFEEMIDDIIDHTIKCQS